MGVLTMAQAETARTKPGELSAVGAGWTDVEPLAEWVGKVNLAENKLESLGFAEGSGVGCLMVAKNKIERLRGLGAMKKLKILDVSGNPLRSLEGAEEAEALTALIAARCPEAVGVSSLAAVGRCGRLETLVLREAHVPLPSLQPIVRMATLTKLSLSQCGLSAMPWGTKPHRLANLTELRLAHNAIPAVDAFLSACKALKILDLGHNNLTDVDGTLARIAELPKLTHLTLQGNPLEAALETRGDGAYRERVVEACRGRLKYLDNDYATDEFRAKKRQKKEEGAAKRAKKEEAAAPKPVAVSFGESPVKPRGERANFVLVSPELAPVAPATAEDIEKDLEEGDGDVFTMGKMTNWSSTAAKASGLRNSEFAGEKVKATSTALDFLTQAPVGSRAW